ncbi:MAG: hypothetical protein R2856_11735 [Caldilineaceae bacterium]
MFSWLHLRDLINQQLLVAPVILPALILGWIGTIWRRSHLDLDSGNGIERGLGGSSGFEQISSDFVRLIRPIRSIRVLYPSRYTLLSLAAGFHLLLTWVWNPDYGGQRDWDLFSLAAIPLTLLLIRLSARLWPDPRFRRAALMPLIVLQILHTAAWIVCRTASRGSGRRRRGLGIRASALS